MIIILSLVLGVVIGIMDCRPAAHAGGRMSARSRGAVRWNTAGTRSRRPPGTRTRSAPADQQRIEDDPRPAEEKLIRQALVPTQEVVEIKNGKKVNVERKLYPGYVLVEMVMNQETLHVVNSIQGVIKFVGTGKLPQPLRHDEVNRLLGIADEVAESEPKEEIPFLVGQAVAITEGPFTDFNGTVEEVLARQGQGSGLGQPLRPADERRARLPAAEGH